MSRGERVHEEAATFVKAARAKKIGKDLRSLSDELKLLRKVRRHVRVEEELAFTSDWLPTSWFADDAWLRVKCDFVVAPLLAEPLRIIDLKTGKQYPKHRDQVELYALGGFLGAWDFIDEMPESIRVELWYSDVGEIVEADYSSSEVSALKRAWEKRTRKMLKDRLFKPTPSSLCRYCDFAAAKGGPCSYGA